MHGCTKPFVVGLLALLLSSPALAAPPEVKRSWGGSGDLIIEFDQPMLTWEGPSATTRMTVTPAAPCTWYWQDDTMLTCETNRGGFEGGLRDATVYRVALAGLWSQAGEEVAPTELRIAHEPPELEVMFRDWHAGWPTIDLVGHHGVTAEAIARSLDLTFKGERLPYRIEPRPRDRYDDWQVHMVFYRLVPESTPPGPGELKAVLRAGLQSPLGDALGESDTTKATVGAPFGFDGLRCYRTAGDWRANDGGPCAPEKPVQLAFTRKLTPASIESIRAALPAGVTLVDGERRCGVDCDNDRVGPVHYLELESVLAGQTWTLRLPAGLQSVDGETLEAPIAVVVPMKSWETGYRIDPEVVVGLPGDTTPPVVEARNLRRGGRWVELSIGADVERSEARVGRSGVAEEFSPVKTPVVAEAVLQNGGVSIGGSRNHREVARGTAVAPFNVLVGRAGEQTLAWASEWADGRAVAGATVDVLAIGFDGSSTLLASGRTGADGVAVLDVLVAPANIYSDTSLRVVRVSSGNRIVVVPVLGGTGLSLSDPVDDIRIEDDYSSYGSGELQFGVTGRLLYRPGETVEYRLWPRRRDGNRLVLPKVRTALPMELKGNDVVHRAWTVDLDEWGSTHGTVALPERLPDGWYCIHDATDDHNSWGNSGACFEVARFGGQAMWAEMDANAPVLLGGERLELAIRGGYFSGGPAAGAKLRMSALVMPADFADAYPAFADYAFLDDNDRSIENDPLEGQPLPMSLDGEGRATVAAALPLRFIDEDPPADGGPDASMPFALMQFNAAVRDDGDTEAASPTAKVHFAEFPRYVGLKTVRWWLPLDADPLLDAVVATHLGEALAGTPVQVRIETIGETPEVLARCELVAGTPAPCAFRAPEAGLYTIVAESADAAPVRIRRWFGSSAQATRADDASVQLALLQAFDGSTPARVRLTQPHAQATALFVVEYDGVRKVWTQTVGADTDIEVPLQAEWAPGVTLRVFIRPATGDTAAGFAAATLERSIVLAIPRAARGVVGFTLADDTLAPGEGATLRLHNDSDGARLVTIAIVDDSVHQQAAWLHEHIDPAGPELLGVLSSWDDSQWLGLQDWKVVPNFFYAPETPRSRPKRAEIERWQPVAAPPAGFSDQATELDTIEVTGSRLKMSEIFMEEPAHERFEAAPGQRPGIAMARVRSRFPDAAYWNPGVVLAPGEHRDLVVPLPDNLTRWRVLVWSSDAGDDFALAQATLTTSLPVELRLGLPDHLYDGDIGSGTINARAAAGAATLSLQANADGAGVASSVSGRGAVAAHATLSRELALAPDVDGEIGVIARAESVAGADAVSGRIPVQTRWAARTLPQAGWLEGTLKLPLPTLAGGVRDPRLALTVSRGADAWRDGWIGELRDYPHRCWEQTLSRGLGAALALADAEGRKAWPDAQSVIDAAYLEAPSFRDDQGNYYFFPPQLSYIGDRVSTPLNAWTLRAFGLLEELGQPVPSQLLEDLDIDDLLPGPKQELTRELAVAAAQVAAARAGTDDPVDEELLRRLWGAWEKFDWHGRSELVRALVAAPALETEGAEGLARLREAGEQHGLRRVIADPRDFGWAMGSSLRDQCAVTATLFDLDRTPENLARRRAFLRGVQDLYAGGTPSLDTQSSVHCLLALRAAAEAGEGAADSELVATLGTATAQLRLDAATPVARWETPAPSGTTLELATPAASDASLSYVAELQFTQDLRDAEATAVGIQLQRRYAVLHDGGWIPVTTANLREGDWVRITLQLSAPAWRHFVAITDPVPGGWTTRDLRLEGVGGAAMRALGDPGSWWFDERQTGAGEVRLYAQSLPPGVHEVHYFAQALHAGEYFAPPATAELMYGRASRSTTAAETIHIAH